MSILKKISLAASLLTVSSAAFAGGGSVTISPDFAEFTGYKCVSADFEVSPARLRTPSIKNISMILQPTHDVLDTISADINNCRVTLTGILTGGESFEVKGLESSCAAGQKLLKLLPVGTHESGWYGNSERYSNILGIKLDQELVAGACKEGSEAYIFFGI